MSSVYKSIISLEEVLDLALILEKRGAEFYAAARDNTQDPECRDFFDWMVSEEDDHYETFLSLRAQYSGSTTPPSLDIPSGYNNFIRLMAQEIIGSISFSEGMPFDEVVAMAIAFEQNTLDYYRKIEELFPQEEAGIIENICLEEEKHLASIRTYRQNGSSSLGPQVSS